MHRIIVAGAGYAGAAAAGYLARRLHPGDVEITVVNAEPHFVERIRLHQVAAGRELPRHDLTGMFAGTGIRLRIARVTALDAGQRTVTVTGRGGTDRLAYDSLLYTLGSTACDRGVPGVAEHAFDVAGQPAALRLHRRLSGLGRGAAVVVVGGNLTGIEVATEIAETRPELLVTLVTSGELGAGRSAKDRRHLRRALTRFGITVHEHTTVTRVGEAGVLAADGTTFPADATVWAAGFAAHPLAAAGGLTVGDDGRIVVDRLMRSVSHPEVYAAGDSVRAVAADGRPLPMSCATAGLTRMQATATILGDRTGHRIAKTPLPHLGNCIGLGSADAILELGRPGTRSLRGRPAAAVKAGVLRGTAWNMHHPAYGLPVRRLRAAAPRSVQTAAD